MTRKLSFQNTTGDHSVLLIKEKLREAGVHRVHVRQDQSSVTVTYDVMVHHLNAIEGLLKDVGHPLSNGKWFKFKLGIWKLLDENTRGRIKSVHQCCNKPPI